MHKLLVAFAFLLPAATAHADDHDGLGVGPRREGFASGVGIDLRRGDTTLGVVVGVYGARASTSQAGSFAGSLGVQHVVMARGRAELSLGARVAVRRERQELGGSTSRYDQLALQAPLRVTLWVTDHVAIHTEVGAEVTRTRTRSEWIDPAIASPVVSADRYLAGGLFGDPLMNLGLTYQF